MKYILGLLTLVVAISACNKHTSLIANPNSKADQVIYNAYKAHGSQKLERANFQFVFRNKQISVQNDGGEYRYESVTEKDGKIIKDQLSNNGMRRWLDGNEIQLSERDMTRYSGGINSVVYFASLPKPLYDPAVNKSYIGTQSIDGKDYDVVEVTFEKEGGGQDHDDTYYYWIGKEDNLIGFFAYNYKVNKGGVRFRSVSKREKINGVVFQDYINYKADVGTPLSELPGLWEKGKLKELSRIDTEDVQFLK